MTNSVRLGDVCTVVSGSTPKSNIPEYWDGNIKWITPAELTDDSYIISDSVRHITELGVYKTGLKPFRKELSSYLQELPLERLQSLGVRCIAIKASKI